MKKFLSLIFFIQSFYFAGAQNLVPNNDFETYGVVPCGWTGGPPDFAAAVIDWTSPTGASPDIHSTLIANTCSNFHPNANYVCNNGSQVPHSGNIFTGFYTYVGGGDYREYIQTKLISPMVIGIPYIVQFYVSLGEESQFATNNLGVGFSTTLTNSGTSNSLGYTPDVLFTNVVNDTANWVLLTDTIVPAQPYEYIIIGNFLNNALTNIVTFDPGACWDRCYYYCDDVTVRPFGALVENTCFGDSTQFSLYNNPNVIANFWNFDDPLSGPDSISYISNPVHFFTAPGTYTVMTVDYFINGSSDTSYTTVVIGSVPAVSLGADTTLCVGDSILLNAGGGYTSYLWSNGSTDSTVFINSSILISVDVNNGGCLASDTINISFAPCSVPVVNLACSDTVWCDKKSIDFFDLSTNNPTSWQWFFPGAQPGFSNLQNPTGIYYANYGAFDVTLIACNASGCDTLFLPSFINEYQLPAIPIITMVNDTLYSSPAFSYQWYLAPDPIPGATNSYYAPALSGSYFVVISDSNGCEVSSSILVIDGVEEIITPEALFFAKKITLYDISGRMLMERKIDNKENIYTFLNNIGNYSRGIYFIVAEGNDKRKVWKTSRIEK